ncbi:type II toxin-antitoxin system RelE/ParE family toxin [Limnoraphis robusta Tam1]|uniref:type II toxin-antitoxin system RelE/ParE family toxin n=1 Tax=Limnoraphis robusta TaxID=1118279 RepID=UPI002B220419|nr:type II toxin-antitoxin system RelE/ParE family toxin [Limnoraphis robusta]MEA5539477.1 type II toxin-antitoxin system RelE/ParE family toxin [Limnoraphis robusta Tam1]
MSLYILSAPARKDLQEITKYLLKFSVNAANHFIDNFEEKCRLLVDFPEMGRCREELAPSLRSLPVDKYVIFYRPIKNGIQIERVLSGYRDFESIFLEPGES